MDRGNIQIAHRHMNVEIVTEVAQILFWEYLLRILYCVIAVYAAYTGERELRGPVYCSVGLPVSRSGQAGWPGSKGDGSSLSLHIWTQQINS